MRIKRSIALSMIAMIVIFSGCGKDKNTEKKESATTEVTTQATIATVEDATEEATTEEKLDKDSDGYVLVDDYVKVVDEVAYVQTEPSQSSTTYRLFEKDDVIKRTGYKDGWTRVVVDDYDFYIASSALKEADMESEEVASVSDATSTEEEYSKPKKIVIDPANQMEINVDTEEIGPGSDEKKQGCSVGHIGVSMDTKEYELNLKYALALKEKLEKKGYEVVMTRETNDVNISNKKRAEIANESGASVFIRIQMNYSSNPYETGIMAVSMKPDNIYNSQLYEESNALATRLLQGISEKNDVVNHGIYETDQMTSINWSGLPVTLIKLGYLSNEAEEAKLISDEYMNKMVDGIVKGIEYYFR